MLNTKARCNADLFVFISDFIFFFQEKSDARHSKLLDKFDHGPIGSIRILPLAVSYIC